MNKPPQKFTRPIRKSLQQAKHLINTYSSKPMAKPKEQVLASKHMEMADVKALPNVFAQEEYAQPFLRNQLEEVKEELKGEQQLTDRQFSAEPQREEPLSQLQGQGQGQGLQGQGMSLAPVAEASPVSLNQTRLESLEKKIDQIMETQQQQLNMSRRQFHSQQARTKVLVNQQRRRGYSRDYKKAVSSSLQSEDRMTRGMPSLPNANALEEDPRILLSSSKPGDKTQLLMAGIYLGYKDKQQRKTPKNPYVTQTKKAVQPVGRLKTAGLEQNPLLADPNQGSSTQDYLSQKIQTRPGVLRGGNQRKSLEGDSADPRPTSDKDCLSQNSKKKEEKFQLLKKKPNSRGDYEFYQAYSIKTSVRNKRNAAFQQESNKDPSHSRRQSSQGVDQKSKGSRLAGGKLQKMINKRNNVELLSSNNYFEQKFRKFESSISRSQGATRKFMATDGFDFNQQVSNNLSSPTRDRNVLSQSLKTGPARAGQLQPLGAVVTQAAYQKKTIGGPVPPVRGIMNRDISPIKPKPVPSADMKLLANLPPTEFSSGDLINLAETKAQARPKRKQQSRQRNETIQSVYRNAVKSSEGRVKPLSESEPDPLRNLREPRAFKIISEAEILAKHRAIEVPGDEDKLNATNLNEPIQNLSDYEEYSLAGGGRKSTRESMKRPKFGASPSKKDEPLKILHISKPRTQFEHAAATYKAEVKDLIKRKEARSKREASPLIDHNQMLMESNKPKLDLTAMHPRPIMQPRGFQSPEWQQQPSGRRQIQQFQKAYGGFGGMKKKAGKKTKKRGSGEVKAAIDNINKKIDILNQNLQNYEHIMDLALNEIPKDVRSLNNSNFNSSSRYQYGEDNAPTFSERSRAVDKFTNKGSFRASLNKGVLPTVGQYQNTEKTMDEMNELQQVLSQYQQDGQVSNLSEKTLKTILDFQSERAQTTQQQRRLKQRLLHESSKNCQGAQDGSYQVLSLRQSSKINNSSQQEGTLAEVADVFPPQRLVTSRHSRQRTQRAGGNPGVLGLTGIRPQNHLHLGTQEEVAGGPQAEFEDLSQQPPGTATVYRQKQFLQDYDNSLQSILKPGEDQIPILDLSREQAVGSVELNPQKMIEEGHRQGFNLTNLSLKLDQDVLGQSGPKFRKSSNVGAPQGIFDNKEQRPQKTSLGNLGEAQNYFDSRGIKNETIFSGGILTTEKSQQPVPAVDQPRFYPMAPSQASKMENTIKM